MNEFLVFVGGISV